MAIQIMGGQLSKAEVDGPTFKALKVTARPIQYGALGIYRIGLNSGSLVANGASIELFQFRWAPVLVPQSYAILYKLAISAGLSVAATVAGALLSFQAIPARSWTVAGSGGTRVDLTGDNGKLRAPVMLASMANDIGMATTAGLTAGTKILDTTPLGATQCSLSLAAITVGLKLNLLNARDGVLFNGYDTTWPYIMSPGEGYVIKTVAAFPASTTWHCGVQTAWAEVLDF